MPRPTIPAGTSIPLSCCRLMSYYTLLHHCSRWSTQRHYIILKYLLKVAKTVGIAHRVVNFQDDCGYTTFHYACRASSINYDVIRVLVEYGVDVKLEGKYDIDRKLNKMQGLEFPPQNKRQMILNVICSGNIERAQGRAIRV